MARKRSTSKALANYDEELARIAAELAKTESSSLNEGSFISLAGGQFTYKGAVLPENSISVVILDHCFENAYYPGEYDADNPQPPSCYALSRDEDVLRPHEMAVTPESDHCEGCPFNEWGSSDTGRGKACKNTRRLALITEDELENVPTADIAYLKIPVTSVKNWAGYVDQLSRLKKKPPFAVITTITIVRDAKTQFKLQFNMEEELTSGQMIGEIMAVREEKLKEGLLFPYQPPEQAEPKTPPRRRKGTRQAPAKKKPPTKAKAPAKKKAPAKAKAPAKSRAGMRVSFKRGG